MAWIRSTHAHVETTRAITRRTYRLVRFQTIILAGLSTYIVTVGTVLMFR